MWWDLPTYILCNITKFCKNITFIHIKTQKKIPKNPGGLQDLLARFAGLELAQQVSHFHFPASALVIP